MADSGSVKNAPDAWRDRLAALIEERDISMRALSIDIGMGGGYIHSILRDGKTPSVDNLAKAAGRLGVTLPYLLYGFEMTPETEEIVRLLEANPDARTGILLILRGKPEP